MELTPEILEMQNVLANRISLGLGLDRDLAHELVGNILDSLNNTPACNETRVMERSIEIFNKMKEAKRELENEHWIGSRLRARSMEMRKSLESIGDSRLYTIRILLGRNYTYLLGCTEKNPFYCKIVAAFLLGV